MQIFLQNLSLVLPSSLQLLLLDYSFVDWACPQHSKLTFRGLMLDDDSCTNSLPPKRYLFLLIQRLLLAKFRQTWSRWQAVTIQRTIAHCIVTNITTTFVTKNLSLRCRCNLSKVGRGLPSRCKTFLVTILRMISHSDAVDVIVDCEERRRLLLRFDRHGDGTPLLAWLDSRVGRELIVDLAEVEAD